MPIALLAQAPATTVGEPIITLDDGHFAMNPAPSVWRYTLGPQVLPFVYSSNSTWVKFIPIADAFTEYADESSITLPRAEVHPKLTPKSLVLQPGTAPPGCERPTSVQPPPD